jgi:hypothetical protein
MEDAEDATLDFITEITRHVTAFSGAARSG